MAHSTRRRSLGEVLKCDCKERILWEAAELCARLARKRQVQGNSITISTVIRRRSYVAYGYLYRGLTEQVKTLENVIDLGRWLTNYLCGKVLA